MGETTLEKNKDYIEFSTCTMMITHRSYDDVAELGITGLIPDRDFLFGNNPFDIPGDVVIVSKRAFDRLQADDQHYRELAKQREYNYELLLTMTGFNTLEELTDYIHDAGKNSKGRWKTLKEIADDAEKDYIFEKDKAEVFQTKNEQLKKKLDGCVELYNELVDKHNELESQIKAWKEATGFNTPDGAKEYLTAKLSESGGVSESLAREVRSWKNATGCDSPGEAKVLISTLTKALVFKETNKDSSLDYEIKYVRGDEK